MTDLEALFAAIDRDESTKRPSNKGATKSPLLANYVGGSHSLLDGFSSPKRLVPGPATDAESASVASGIARRDKLARYVGNLAPVVDQFSSPGRAARTGKAALGLAAGIGEGVAGSIRSLGNRPQSASLASQFGRAVGRVPAIASALTDAAPEIGKAVVDEAPSIAMEFTGIPSLQRAEASARRADDSGDGLDSLAVIGNTAGAALGLMPGAAAASKLGKLRSISRGVKVAKNSRIGSSRLVPALAVTATLSGLGTGEALAATPKEDLERELLLDSRGEYIPPRSADEASKAGFLQGLSLATADDVQRRPELAARLSAARSRFKDNPGDIVAYADLRRTSARYDPIADAALGNEDHFRSAQIAGEAVTGAGTALLSTLVGRKIGAPNLANAVAAAIKGGLYGAGDGLGERTDEERLTRAGVDALISTAVAGATVPLAKRVALEAVRSPIRTQQLDNLVRRVRGKPAGADSATKSRLDAPPERQLNPAINLAEQVALLRAGGNSKRLAAVRESLSASPGVSEVFRDEAEALKRRTLNYQANKLLLPDPKARSVPEPLRHLVESAFDPNVRDDWLAEVSSLTIAERNSVAKAVVGRVKAADAPLAIYGQQFTPTLAALGITRKDGSDVGALLSPLQMARITDITPASASSTGAPIENQAALTLAQMIAKTRAAPSKRTKIIPEPLLVDGKKQGLGPGRLYPNRGANKAEGVAKPLLLSAAIPLTDALDDALGYDDNAGSGEESDLDARTNLQRRILASRRAALKEAEELYQSTISRANSDIERGNSRRASIDKQIQTLQAVLAAQRRPDTDDGQEEYRRKVSKIRAQLQRLGAEKSDNEKAIAAQKKRLQEAKRDNELRGAKKARQLQMEAILGNR